MSSSNRGERIETLQKLLKKHYKPIAIPSGRNVLENLIYACLLEDAKFEVADELFAKAQHEYHDWNEARVTTITELAELFAIHPLPVQVAVRLKKALQAIFEARYSYDIEDLLKLNLGKAIETIEAWVPTSKFVSAFMQQNAFGGHSIAVDNSTMQALVSIGVAQSADMLKGAVSGLDRAVPKAKGGELFSLVHQFGVEFIADRKAPGVQAIMDELGIEIAAPKPTKPTKPVEKTPPVAPPAPAPAPAPAAKKNDKKEVAKEAVKEPTKDAGKDGGSAAAPAKAPAGKPTTPAKPTPPIKAAPPAKTAAPIKPSIPAKPPLQIHVKNATKPDAAKSDTKSGGKQDGKGKQTPPPKPASKDVGPKPGKGDTKKPTKPVGKTPPPPPQKPTKKAPPPPASNKGIAKKKPK